MKKTLSERYVHFVQSKILVNSPQPFRRILAIFFSRFPTFLSIIVFFIFLFIHGLSYLLIFSCFSSGVFSSSFDVFCNYLLISNISLLLLVLSILVPSSPEFFSIEFSDKTQRRIDSKKKTYLAHYAEFIVNRFILKRPRILHRSFARFFAFLPALPFMFLVCFLSPSFYSFVCVTLDNPIEYYSILIFLFGSFFSLALYEFIDNILLFNDLLGLRKDIL